MKDEREVLTRYTILQKLIREAKRTIVGAVLMLILGSSVFFAMWLLLSDSVIASVLIGVFALVFFAVCFFFIVRALLVISKAHRGGFTVVEDTLADVENSKLSWWRLIINLGSGFRASDISNDVFYFRSGKRFVANRAEYQNTHLSAAADFSQKGDKFIVVFYNDAPERIVLLYSMKIYSYKEI